MMRTRQKNTTKKRLNKNNHGQMKTTYSYGGVHALDIALLDKDLPRLQAQVLDFSFGDDFALKQGLDLSI